ncbi:hypothetical protein [Conexibacter arvalis]|uniref:Alpha-beta hydrolase superfamily lysophospholipase n=1 Tax=Conexibacter arvalis TaxID=912552 RepID=A0A840I9L0_9ACTN|nr:hypothetical protein [Conexibacter arvalis]MBB4660913.1 alpha-beta hydrolase superfamily lysophospholipase [Conexibacter arvalis]
MTTRTPAPEAELTLEQAVGLRLARQRLDRPAPPAEALGVVSGLCGLHAQLMSSAELTLWARVDGLSTATPSRRRCGRSARS